MSYTVERILTPEVANEVWDVLVAEAGANPDNREEFVAFATSGQWHEFRVGGKLGFRGKVVNQGERIFVSGDYNEELIPGINKKLEKFERGEFDRSWDYEVEIFIPLSMGWEEAYQATKHLTRITKTCSMSNPNHSDREHAKRSFVGNCYVWTLTFNRHILPQGWRYLVPGEIMEKTDMYWSNAWNRWVWAYEGVVGQPWGQDDPSHWAHYIRHKSLK